MADASEMENSGKVYADILIALTSGLYNKIEYAVREYLQNSYDAIKEAHKNNLPEPADGYLVQVSISENNKDLLIFDNGIGMDLELLHRYTSIGGGSKNRVDYTGHKGIGKLSGLRFFDKFVVRTKRYGSNKGLELVWSSGEMMKALNDNREEVKRIEYHKFISDYITFRDIDGLKECEHFTQIQLIGIHDDFAKTLNKDHIGIFIKRNCPVPFNQDKFKYSKSIMDFLNEDAEFFDNTINESLICQYYDDSKHNLVDPIFKIIKYDSKIKAKVWYSWIDAEAKDMVDGEISGIRFREKGIVVGNADLFHNMCAVGNVDKWFTGEVIVLDTEITPNSARDGFIQGKELDKFFKTLKEQVGKELRRIADIRSAISAAESDLEKLRKSIEQNKPITRQEVSKLETRKKDIQRYSSNPQGFPISFAVLANIESTISEIRSVEISKGTEAENVDLSALPVEELMKVALDSKEKESKCLTSKAITQQKEIGKKASDELIKRVVKEAKTQQEIVVSIVSKLLTKYNIRVHENDIIALYQNEITKADY
jgi:hypothetical protein